MMKIAFAAFAIFLSLSAFATEDAPVADELSRDVASRPAQPQLNNLAPPTMPPAESYPEPAPAEESRSEESSSYDD